MSKIVIDIPDNYKDLITSAWSYGVAPNMSVLEDVSKAVMNGIPLDDIKSEIREETECHYGDKCLGANCPSNTDCMIMGEHAIEIIDKHLEGNK